MHLPTKYTVRYHILTSIYLRTYAVTYMYIKLSIHTGSEHFTAHPAHKVTRKWALIFWIVKSYLLQPSAKNTAFRWASLVSSLEAHLWRGNS